MLKNQRFGMNKKISWTALYMFFCFQFGILLSAQDLPNEAFKILFEDKVTNIHQEKVFLHLDKSLYMSGESIWISFYCMDAAFHSPVGISKVGNIELINDQGQSIKKNRIKLTNGMGQSYLLATPDLRSGSYTIRGYTNWMKNFDSDLVFQKNIIILNTDQTSIDQGVQDTSAKITVEFFPEGGPLVNNLESKMAIKAKDIAGGGVEVLGTIVDQTGAEVAKFKTSEKGFSSLRLTPREGYIYSALFFQDSFARRILLPKAKSKGIVLSVVEQGMHEYLVKIQSSVDEEKKLLLVLHTRGIIQWIKNVDLAKQIDVKFQSDNLSSGISHLTLLDENFAPIAERLIFKYPNSENALELHQKKGEYSTREKVTLSLNSYSLPPDDSLAHLSISVFRAQNNYRSEENILSNLLLTSDLKCKIRNPLSYFDPTNKYRFDQMDLLMLSNGWSRFEWKEISDNQPAELEYPAEINAPLLSGELLVNTTDSKPSNLQIGFFKNSSFMNSTSLNTTGRFHFELPWHLKDDKIQFFLKDEILNSSQVRLHSPFDLSFEKSAPIPLYYANQTKKYFDDLYTNIQISQVYRDYNFINGKMTNSVSESDFFYGQPDHLYLLDDYTRFETVQDIFIEYIRKVRIRNNGENNNFYMLKDHKFLTSSALVLMDGIPIRDIDFILNLDPLKIEKIELITDVYHTAEEDYYGIVNFVSYNNDLMNQKMPPDLIQKVYHAIQETKEFYAPDYTKLNDDLKTIPDYRSTLYWNPNVKMNTQNIQEISFYTSDDLGYYQIEINGITNTGRPLYWQDNFIVKEK